MEMHEYIDILTGQMRSKKAGKMVAEEMYAHLEDQALAYEEAGMNRESAVQEAVRQMGDPVEVGAALDRIHRPRMDYKMLLAVIVLSMIGVFLSYRGLHVTDSGGTGFLEEVFSVFFSVRCVIVFAGIACMIAVCFLDYTIFYQYAPFFFLLFAVFSKIVCSILPEEHGGYTYLGQYIYLFLPLYGALLYRLRGYGYRVFLCCAGFMISLVIAVAPFFYIGFAFRFGVAALFMTCLAVNRGWFRGNRRWMQLLTWGIPTVAVLVWVMKALQTNTYRSNRIRAFLHMQSEATGYYEYYLESVREILGRLQWFGVTESSEIWKSFMDTAAAANGSHNLLYLFVSKGILAGVLVLILYLLCWVYLLRISLRQKNELGKLVGFGCTILLGIEAFDYVFVNLGVLLPSNSVMPFLQSGQVGTIVYYFLIGILLSIYRYQDILPVHPERSKAVGSSKYRISFRIEKVQNEQHKMSFRKLSYHIKRD